MKVLGITGNIASGKSTVAGILAELGADVIDADSVVHRLYRSGTPTHRAIVDRFGESVEGRHGIDRKALSSIAFADPAAMSDLESIVHPAVVRETRRLISMPSQAPAKVIEAIKLVESDLVALPDRLWIVDADRDVRLARLVENASLDPNEAARRIDAQSSPETVADQFARRRPGTPLVTIQNDGDIEIITRRVEAEWRDFLS